MMTESAIRRVSRRGEGVKRAMALFQESGFILSELRFRNKSATFVENDKGSTFGNTLRNSPLHSKPAKACIEDDMDCSYINN